MTLLAMDGVIKKLGKRSFGPYTLDINHAECIAIVGPNGSGKSTLLKLISGTYSPNLGRILLNYRPLGDWSTEALSKNRAVLMQSHNIAFALTARVVIGLGRVTRDDELANARIVAQAAALLGVSSLLNQTVDTLSGGELARVQLARVAAQLWDVEDGLILMDEPIAAVDPGLQDFLLETLMLFARIRRHAVIAVMHDLNHALRYFSRLVLVHPQGELESVLSGIEAKHALERLYSVRLSCLKDEQGDLVMLPLRATNIDPW